MTTRLTTRLIAAAPAFYESCWVSGLQPSEDEPVGMDRLGWLSCLLRELEGNHEAWRLLSADDPGAFRECLDECWALHNGLAAALAKVRGTPSTEPAPGESPREED